MKIDVAQLQYLIKGFHLDEKIIILGYGVSIILIIGSNMSCINVLTCTHNLCNLIIAIGSNFDVNMTIKYSLNSWDQFIIA